MALDRFLATPDWPIGNVGQARAEAVQELIANHTLIVGQSRSGKTNAARRLLEQILLWTDTRIVLLDPNADFRWLNEVNPNNAELELTDRDDFPRAWARLQPQIKIVKMANGAPWGIPWGKLSLDEMAAFLKLDPAENFEEYQVLRGHHAFEEARSKERKGGADLGTIHAFKDSPYFQEKAGEAVDRYRLRLDKLATLPAWALETGTDLDSLLTSEFRAAVIDLSIDDEDVRAITAARALEVLWRQGEQHRTATMRASADRKPPWPGTLVVIDEAHVFAGTGPFDPQRRLLSERIERFSDQGKKFNLYLMLVTQQPNKLNQRILAECNNRIILRMNERLSLKVLEDTYGGIRGRYDGALTFRKGEALLEGALLCDENPPSSLPRGVRFLRASTREGGASPQMAWARPKDRLG